MCLFNCKPGTGTTKGRSYPAGQGRINCRRLACALAISYSVVDGQVLRHDVRAIVLGGTISIDLVVQRVEPLQILR